jgi:hypothetical protein
MDPQPFERSSHHDAVRAETVLRCPYIDASGPILSNKKASETEAFKLKRYVAD